MRNPKTIILLLVTLLYATAMSAQRERNYIYLVDCTKSMTGFGGSPDIWQPTKDYLHNELTKHRPGTTLHVVPFQGKVHPAINFNAGNLKWADIEKSIDSYVEMPTNTNICDAWDAIDHFIDLHKDNYIILLTDGKDNVQGMDAVARKLSSWCGKYPNTYAFYVQLTKAAVDKKVAEVIDICENEFVVDASKGKDIPVFGGFEKGIVIYANTLNLDRHHLLAFSSAGEYAAKATCSDPWFDVAISDGKISNGRLEVQIKARKPVSDINNELPPTYSFTFDVQSDEVRIINPTVKVIMTNKPERALELLSEETDIGRASWYDSFLFWGADTPDTLYADLKAVFNDEARKDRSAIELQVSDEEGNNDFDLFFNGQPVKDGRIVMHSQNQSPTVLALVYHPSAKEGKRYLSIKPVAKHELDNINDQPVEQYILTLRSRYSVGWNPLKTILTWAGILLLAALLLWFLMLRRLFFPPISVKTIQISDPYFSNVNVKGMRRVVFTDKKMSQSLFSRLFTGEILYKKNDVWTSPLTLEAGSKRKTLRVVRTRDYTFDPYTAMLKSPEDYVVENVNDKTKIKMTIN